MSDMSEKRADLPIGMTGLISLLSIFGHFGIKTDQKDFLKENEANKKDITIKQIMDISKKRTLRAEHLKPTADELREIELPVIARMNNGCYVVIAARTDEAVSPHGAHHIPFLQKIHRKLAGRHYCLLWQAELELFQKEVQPALVLHGYQEIPPSSDRGIRRSLFPAADGHRHAPDNPGYY